MQTKTNTKIAFIGKFARLHDEEYIARSFEAIGCEVLRVSISIPPAYKESQIKNFKPDIILYTKWISDIDSAISSFRKEGVKTVCWLFDLYFNYHREYQVSSYKYFKSDYVFTTDNGHAHRWVEKGINHHCVRQGIYKDECILLPFESIKHEVVFVGSDNPLYPERKALISKIGADWYGKKNTNEVRGLELNKLYASTRIVIGDSYPSSNYWSNRVVETLGRGGFLIHKETEGLKEEYPYLVTYTDEQDLLDKIEYYKTHEEERRDIVKKNFEWVRDNYTMDKKCKELLNYIS